MQQQYSKWQQQTLGREHPTSTVATFYNLKRAIVNNKKIKTRKNTGKYVQYTAIETGKIAEVGPAVGVRRQRSTLPKMYKDLNKTLSKEFFKV